MYQEEIIYNIRHNILSQKNEQFVLFNLVIMCSTNGILTKDNFIGEQLIRKIVSYKQPILNSVLFGDKC